MTTHPLPTLLRTSLLAGLVLGTHSLAAELDFQKDILPLLQQKCIDCHGAEKQKGKLRLDSKEATLKGGKDGPAVKAKDAARSELIKRVSCRQGMTIGCPPRGMDSRPIRSRF